MKIPSKSDSSRSKKPQSSGATKKRDRSLTEEKLIKAGIEIFSKYGFDGATTKMISKRSNVNESLIMRYFGGKEGLLVEIVRRFFEEIHETPLAYPPQESLEAEMLQFCRYSFQISKQHKAIMRIMLFRAAIDPKMKKKFLSFINLAGDPRLIERLQVLKEKLKLPKELDQDLIHLITFTTHSANFVSEILFESEKQTEIEKNLEILISKTVKGLLAK